LIKRRSDAVKEPFKSDLIRNIYHVLGLPEIIDILVNSAEENKIEVADPGIKIGHLPTHKDQEACEELGHRIGKVLNQRA
jgi:flavorubredoxin